MIGHSPDCKYLERLLNKLKPILNSVSFVVTDDKDDCIEVIKSTGLKHSIKRKVYEKREEFNFSEVRNMALDMALEYDGWCFWLDCDDYIENPEELLSQVIEKSEKAECFLLPYNVNERSGNLRKVRIHKNNFRWVGNVHEECMPIIPNEEKQVQGLALEDIVVHHRPDKEKSNHDFHISLLKKNIETSEADYCYLAKEYFNSLKFEEALPYIKKTIAIHSYPHEKYHMMVMLGLCYLFLDQKDKAIEAWQEAIHYNTYRREAYYHLAEQYGILGGTDNIYKGLGYISACNAQLDRKEPLQNDSIYKHLGYKLHARYLQKLKFYKEGLMVLEKVKQRDEEYELIKKELEDACT